MDGILEAIAERFRTDQELSNLVSPDNVLVGPPIPGRAIPAIAFAEARITKETITSSGRHVVRVSVDYQAEVASEPQAATLACGLMKRLTEWETQSLRSMAITGITGRWYRRADSANEQWVLEGTLDYLAEDR